MQLARVLGLRTVVSTSAGLTFATSCFVATAQLAAYLAGDAAWIAVLVAGLLSLGSAAAFSELSSMYPTSAGLRLYVRQAFGDRVAIVFSLFYMLIVTAVVGAEAYVLGRVLAHAVPAVPPLAWIVALLAVATLLNLRGLKVAGRFQDVITYGMIASLLAISLVGLARLGWSLPAPFALGGGANLFQAVSAGVFLFIGFEWVTPLAEEVTGNRLIARGMFIAVGLLSVVYALFSAAMAPWLSHDELRSSPIPHVLFGERLLGVAGMVWMTVTSLGASSTTFNAGLATVSRFLYACAREGLLPNLAVRCDVIGTIDVEVIDLVPGHELIDIDGARRLDVDCFEVCIGDLDVAFALADLVPFDDLVRGHDVAGLGVDPLEVEAVARRFIELVEVNLFGLRRRRIEQDRAGHEGKAKVALPVGARGHCKAPDGSVDRNVRRNGHVPSRDRQTGPLTKRG